MLLSAQVRRGVPEEQKHHGGGMQLLLGCNLGCRERGHSSRDTNTLFCLLAAFFFFKEVHQKKLGLSGKYKSFKDVLVPWKTFRSSVLEAHSRHACYREIFRQARGTHRESKDQTV